MRREILRDVERLCVRTLVNQQRSTPQRTNGVQLHYQMQLSWCVAVEKRAHSRGNPHPPLDLSVALAEAHTLLLPSSSRSPWDISRAFHSKNSSVKCLSVRFGATYASASGGGGDALEILSAPDPSGFGSRTCIWPIRKEEAVSVRHV